MRGQAAFFSFNHPKNTADAEPCPVGDALWKWKLTFNIGRAEKLIRYFAHPTLQP